MSLATAIVLLWTQSTPDAALAVDHRAVDCTVAESYPRLLASVRPAGSVARARVYSAPKATATGTPCTRT